VDSGPFFYPTWKLSLIGRCPRGPSHSETVFYEQFTDAGLRPEGRRPASLSTIPLFWKNRSIVLRVGQLSFCLRLLPAAL